MEFDVARNIGVIIKDPVPKQLEWKAIENLLIAIDADVIEGRGFRVRFHKNGEMVTFHRPHPSKEAKPYQVLDARDFLDRLGSVDLSW